MTFLLTRYNWPEGCMQRGRDVNKLEQVEVSLYASGIRSRFIEQMCAEIRTNSKLETIPGRVGGIYRTMYERVGKKIECNNLLGERAECEEKKYWMSSCQLQLLRSRTDESPGRNNYSNNICFHDHNLTFLQMFFENLTCSATGN